MNEKFFNGAWLRLFGWLGLMEAVLLVSYVVRAKSAGLHDIPLFLLGLTQLPGFQVMSLVNPEEAEGSGARVFLYYVGVLFWQMMLIAVAVSFIQIVRRLLRRSPSSV